LIHSQTADGNHQANEHRSFSHNDLHLDLPSLYRDFQYEWKVKKVHFPAGAALKIRRPE
jgi:hypothetical protein